MLAKAQDPKAADQRFDESRLSPVFTGVNLLNVVLKTDCFE